MQKHQLIIATLTTTIILSVAFFQVGIANEKGADAKSVAYYVANIKEALAKNQECYKQQDAKANEDCANSLHALQITHVGGDKISGYKYQ